MSNLPHEPALRWWMLFLIGGLVLLLCVAPTSAVMGSWLLVSGSPGCGNGATGQVADATPTATLPGGCGLDPEGNGVVAWAISIAAHLYPCPDRYDPGQLPPFMDVCYDRGMPAAVIKYWQTTCPGCRQWQNGNLQCVMLVLAAYGLGGARAPVAGNAITFWWNYAHIPGWTEIPSFFAPGTTTVTAAPSTRRLPQPGDMLVWYISWDPFVGHIGVVVKVTPPSAGTAGRVTFAEANGPTPLYAMSINPDLTVNTWPGYYVAGYIRYAGAARTPQGEDNVESERAK